MLRPQSPGRKRCLSASGCLALRQKHPEETYAFAVSAPLSLRLAAAVGVLGSLILLAAPVSQAQAQSWPQRPVRFIIPFGPGAGADIGARLIQERLQKKWGQPVVIENRPGGD